MRLAALHHPRGTTAFLQYHRGVLRHARRGAPQGARTPNATSVRYDGPVRFAVRHTAHHLLVFPRRKRRPRMSRRHMGHQQWPGDIKKNVCTGGRELQTTAFMTRRPCVQRAGHVSR